MTLREKSRYRRTKDGSPLRKGETYGQVLDRLCPIVFGTPHGKELLAALFDRWGLSRLDPNESESALRGHRFMVNLLLELEAHTEGRAPSDATGTDKRDRHGTESGNG